MDIKSFEVWNFKSIEYSGEIQFPKITILIGSNSSGKSSIGQSLLLMKQTFEAEEPSIPLVLNGPHIQLGEYGDFIHGKIISRPFIIKFIFEEYKKEPYKCEVCGAGYKLKGWFFNHVKKEHPKYWGIKQSEISDEKYHLSKKPSLKFQYMFNPETKIIFLKEIEIEHPPSTRGLNLASLKIEQLKERLIKFEAISINGKKIYSKTLKIPVNLETLDHNLFVNLFIYFTQNKPYHLISSKLIEQISLIENDLGNILDFEFPEKINLSGYSLFWRPTSQLPKSLNEEQKIALGIEYGLYSIARFMASRLQDIKMFLQGAQHIGPLRNWPERIYFGTGGKPTSVGVRGEFTHELFWIDKRVGHEKLLRDINDWLEKLKFGIELDVDSLGVGEIYQLKVKEKDLSFNITDVGFGLSQILPIITECINYSLKATSKKSRFQEQMYHYEGRNEDVNKILIIEQPEIHLNPRIQAELGDFFIKVSKPDRALLIETHSEHIISRIQRRVAEGTLDPTDVVIYFVSRQDNKSETKKISISSTGKFSYWPEGFFQDDFEDAIEILKKSLRQQKEI